MTGAVVLLLSAVFVIAAFSKLQSKAAFVSVLRGLLPTMLVEPAAVLVPVAELALAAFLLSEIRPQQAVVCAIVMLAVFTIVLSLMWRQGIKGCACFGENADTAATGSGIARNIILIAVAVPAASISGPIALWGPDISSLLGRLTLVTGALCLWPCMLALVNRRRFFANGLSAP